MTMAETGSASASDIDIDVDINVDDDDVDDVDDNDDGVCWLPSSFSVSFATATASRFNSWRTAGSVSCVKELILMMPTFLLSLSLSLLLLLDRQKKKTMVILLLSMLR